MPEKRFGRRLIGRSALVIATALLLSNSAFLFAVQTQTSGSEAQSAWVVERLDLGPAFWPVLVVDSWDQVHALWVHQLGQAPDSSRAAAVFYARRSPDGSWTEPVDVLVGADGGAIRTLAATIDDANRIHLIANLGDGLYHSTVHAESAHRATNWSALRRISRANAGPSGIAHGPGDALHVVYPEIYAEPGVVFYVRSADGGATWSRSVIVSNPNHPRAVATNAQIAVASSGRLHVVWTETIEVFPPVGVFYAFSDDGGQSWSTPRLLGENGYNWISPGLEAGGEVVHLVWSGTGEVQGKYHALSRDAGLTWSEPEMVFYGWAGFLGFSDLELDSAGQLHLATALNRASSSQGADLLGDDWYGPGAIFHSVWLGDSWSTPEHVSAEVWEPRLEQCCPSLAISEGNLLHIAWSGTYHPEDEVRPVWYAFRRVDAPRIETSGTPTVTSHALPSPTLAVVPTPVPGNTKASTAEPATRQPLPPPEDLPQDSTTTALLAGVVPVVVLALAVVGVVARRRSSRRR